MYNDITCFILAGGKSTRMGANKSLLTIGGMKVIERVAEMMKDLFNNVIIITNQWEEYEFLKLPMHEDIYKDIGPLAGIHSALVHTFTERNFIISCDIPLMTPDVIKYLVDYKTNKPITITKADNFIQQLCGIYSQSLVHEIKNILEKSMANTEIRNPEQKKRGCSVLELVNNSDALIIDIEKEYKDYKPGTFFNMNSAEEYKYIKTILTQS
jgi:molybdopterin-guanine dinucleotide biosynthesis protein A